jgi:enamine deaminase RidA (YjgF/YER057c/UK114 family)
MVGGKLGWTGKLGGVVSPEDGKQAARTCLLNVLAQLSAACDGDLDRVARVVRLGGFIACTPDFIQHPAVMNGASDLAVEIFGDAGKHARATVGVPSLPLDAPVEIEGMFEID